MVLPRLFNTALRSAFTAAKRNVLLNRGLASAAPVPGKVRYVPEFKSSTELWIGPSRSRVLCVAIGLKCAAVAANGE